LLLVGSMNEPVLSGVRKLVRELNLQTKVIECGSRSDVGRLLSASDLMLFPSLREGLPGAVVEAAAVGTPVLASDLAPMLEISRYLPIRTMSLLESDEAWSAACVELCKDTTIRSRLIGAFAASPFTIPATVAAFQRVYRVAGDAHEQYA
jgi:glycosyltransferase involved in cell wall biosynthesis